MTTIFEKFNYDIANKLVAPQLYHTVATEKTMASVTFWKKNKQRLSLVYCTLFLQKYFAQGLAKHGFARIKTKKKHYRQFFVDISQSNLLLENLFRLELPIALGTAHGHDIFLKFRGFYLRIHFLTGHRNVMIINLRNTFYDLILNIKRNEKLSITAFNLKKNKNIV